MRHLLFLGLMLCLLLPFSSALDITSCTNLSYSNLVYDIKNNITQAGDACLHIRADNITINCSGYDVNSGSGFAIRLGTSGECHSNITIRNCNMSGYGGLAISNGYSGGIGCSCGYTIGDYFNNNDINATTQGISMSCVTGMMASNNTIILGSTINGIGIYDTYGGSSYFDNLTMTTPLGIGYKAKYCDNTILNHSSIIAIGGTAIFNQEHSSEIIDYSFINASNGGYSFLGTPLIRHSSIHVNQTGFQASNSDVLFLYDSQIIANDSGSALSCDAISYWPYYDAIIQRSNLTSVNGIAVKNGNAVWSIPCNLMMDSSYVFSNNSNALEEYDNGYYMDSIFETNGTDKSAIVSSSLIHNSTFFNVTLIANGGGYELRELSHNKAVYLNLTFNGSGYPTLVTITNTSNNMNFTSANLSFLNYTVDALRYLNISSPAPFYAHLQMHYSNETNESQWIIKGWDGYTLTNVSDSAVNTTYNYVNGTASWAGIFAIMGNGTMLNFTPGTGTCAYYGNCTIGTNCTADSDCASGSCYEGECTHQITAIVDIFAGTSQMIGFLFALIVLVGGAAIGFRFGGTMGAIIVDIVVLCVFSILPTPLLPWWMTIVGLIAAVVGAIMTMGNRQEG